MGVPPGTPDDDETAWRRHAACWNRMVAQSLLNWLAPPPGLVWLDANCGDGALAREIAAQAAPARVWATDPSSELFPRAWHLPGTARVSFHVADMAALPFPPGSFDRAVSGTGLVKTDMPLVLARLRRVLRPGGEMAVFVWDTQGRMQPRHHYQVASGSSWPEAMTPAAVVVAMARLGFGAIATRDIDIPVVFRDFDEYWALFADGAEPEALHCRALDATARDMLRTKLQEAVVPRPDGSLAMIARAWAVRGVAR